MAKSYYKILGIPATASGEEIKSAYRRLAKQYHPDHCPEGSDTFKDIHEAYCVLGDPDKRRQYERENPPQPVRVRRQCRAYPDAEPLIPEQEPTRMRRPRRQRSAEHRMPEDIFDWILRRFF